MPVFESVTVCTALVVFTNCSGKVRLVGVTAAMDCVPNPLSEMFNSGVSGSELLMMSTVLRLPMAVGLKVILTVQEKFAASPAPPIEQVLAEMAKSAALPPDRVMPFRIKAAFPLFVRVRVCGVVVTPTVMLPNWKALFEGVITGAVPVPVKATDSGVGFELAIAIVATRVPAAAGRKVTVMVQLKPAANALPQLLVCTKSPAFAPVMVMPVIASVPAPAAFDRVTVCGALEVFTNSNPNGRAVGDTDAFAAVPTLTTPDHAEERLPRIAAFHG